jgi:hypothetical protein
MPMTIAVSCDWSFNRLVSSTSETITQIHTQDDRRGRFPVTQPHIS